MSDDFDMDDELPSWMDDDEQPGDQPDDITEDDALGWLDEDDDQSEQAEGDDLGFTNQLSWTGDDDDASDEDASELSSDDEMPDWLQDGDDVDADYESGDEAPDWLQDDEDVPVAEDLPQSDELPDWLGDEDDELAAEPVSEAEEAPDWYLGVGDADGDEVPDWLQEDAPAEEDPLGDSLAEFPAGTDEVFAASTAEEPLPDDLFAELPDEDELPVFDDIAGEPAEDEPDFDDLFADLPLEDEPALDATSDEPVDAEPDLDDLFADIPLEDEVDFDEELAEPEDEQTPVAELDDGDDLAWLDAIDDEAPELEQAADSTADVLDNLPALEAPGTDLLVGGSVDDLLASLDTGDIELPKTGELPTFDDSLDLDDLFSDTAFDDYDMAGAAQEVEIEDGAEEDDTGEELVRGEVSDLLEELGAPTGDVSATAIVRQRQERALDDLPESLQKLHARGAQLPSPETDAAPPETIRKLLPGVSDILPPTPARIDFVPSSATPALSEGQRTRVDLLKSLAGELPGIAEAPGFDDLGFDDEEPDEADEISPQSKIKTRRRINVLRIAISAIVAAAIIAPFFVDDTQIGDLPPIAFAIDDPQAAVFDHVAALRPNDLVLVAAEYGPTGAGELDSLTDVLLRHILLRGARPVITGTNPVGLLHADNLVNALARDADFTQALGVSPSAERGDFYTLRFLSGNAVGLRALSEDTAEILKTNSRGEDINLRADSLNDFALLIVVAERADDLRAWIEQVSSETNTPMVAAVGFSAAPLAEPFLEADFGANSTGIDGLLVGFADALTYGTMLEGGLAVGDAPAILTEEPGPTEQQTDSQPTQPAEATEPPPTEEPGPTEAPTDSQPTQPAEATEPPPTATPEPTEEPATETSIPPTATSVPPTETARPPTATPAPPTTTASPSAPVVTTGAIAAPQAVNLREGPGTSFRVITPLQPGTALAILGQDEAGSWFNVRTPDGVEGWVSGALLRLDAPLPPTATLTPTPTPTLTATANAVTTATITALQTVNVRSGPEVTFDRVASLEPGTQVDVLGQNDDGVWFNIRTPDGVEGWVRFDLLTLDESAFAPPARAPRLSRRPAALFSRSAQGTPTGEEAAATPTAEILQAAAPQTVPALPPHSTERWYATNLGIIAAAAVIGLGAFVNIIRAILRRDRS